MTGSDSPYRCIGCGHVHPAPPARNQCANCGRATVVDLSNPSAEDVRRAIRAGPAFGKLRRELFGGITFVLAMVAVVALTAVLLQPTPDRAPPTVTSRVLRFVLAAPPGVDPGSVEPDEARRIEALWRPRVQRLRDAIAERSHGLDGCVEGGLDGTEILVRLTVAGDGTVNNVRADEDGPAMETTACAVAVIEQWRLAEVSESVWVEIPFRVVESDIRRAMVPPKRFAIEVR